MIACVAVTKNGVIFADEVSKALVVYELGKSVRKVRAGSPEALLALPWVHTR